MKVGIAKGNLCTFLSLVFSDYYMVEPRIQLSQTE